MGRPAAVVDPAHAVLSVKGPDWSETRRHCRRSALPEQPSYRPLDDQPRMATMVQRSFVLVPGAGGNAGYWQLVEPLIQQAGFGSVGVSLPNWPGATFADHADAIVAAAGQATEITLVAQSMGAFSAPLTCNRLPVAELVLLNAMIPAPGETAGEWWGNTGQAEALRANDLREGRDPDAGFDAQTHFLHDLTPDVLAALTQSGDEEPAESLFETPFFRSINGLTCRPVLSPVTTTGSFPSSSNAG